MVYNYKLVHFFPLMLLVFFIILHTTESTMIPYFLQDQRPCKDDETCAVHCKQKIRPRTTKALCLKQVAWKDSFCVCWVNNMYIIPNNELEPMTSHYWSL
ncbi:hypothetical protein PanWU01x14_354600 [Parasponia andersonii]|uniref:Uncharacterized protein n=2 Tax=Parasponia andersonii TaxID=3476 RepID=A0A2P5A9K1_PARAD|nr:hypothetical protein PanWU01x14_354600 [Parasponia andersonii]